jgi:hypothetical protein
LKSIDWLNSLNNLKAYDLPNYGNIMGNIACHKRVLKDCSRATVWQDKDNESLFNNRGVLLIAIWSYYQIVCFTIFLTILDCYIVGLVSNLVLKPNASCMEGWRYLNQTIWVNNKNLGLPKIGNDHGNRVPIIFEYFYEYVKLSNK